MAGKMTIEVDDKRQMTCKMEGLWDANHVQQVKQMMARFFDQYAMQRRKLDLDNQAKVQAEQQAKQIALDKAKAEQEAKDKSTKAAAQVKINHLSKQIETEKEEAKKSKLIEELEALRKQIA